ncbi:hypothetical protein [Botryobacter ruber]|uniref:hypothetical protein n=1 Tax=Botryobacter ruber TaxID=2171629 RepID=UPI000F64D150|nr:hypothetical protein [Botryobacter ruber]
MKRSFITLLPFLILISCYKPDNQYNMAKSEGAENVTALPEVSGDAEVEFSILFLKNLILNSDSIYLLIGETSPNKGYLYIKERLISKDDIKSLADFIPKDTSTKLIVYPADTIKGDIPPPPPPPRWGRPIGVLRIYNASVSRSVDFAIDSSDTFVFSHSGRRRMAFTRDGDAYFRRIYREYKSLQPRL